MHYGKNSLLFNDMTNSFSILAHEMGHSIIHCAGGLVAHGQSGALDESLADAFSVMAQHYHARVDADGPDTKWLIGEGIRNLSTGGDSLRSMKAPGEGCIFHFGSRDTSIGHMRDFRYLRSWEAPHPIRNDYGYIHSNCGIPNRAFVLAAERIGGPSYGKVGRV